MKKGYLQDAIHFLNLRNGLRHQKMIIIEKLARNMPPATWTTIDKNSPVRCRKLHARFVEISDRLRRMGTQTE